MVEEKMSLAMWSERNRKRRELLTSYFFDLSKLMCGGVVVGGLSPLFTGREMGLYNYLCILFGGMATALFAYFANEILKVELRK